MAKTGMRQPENQQTYTCKKNRMQKSNEVSYFMLVFLHIPDKNITFAPKR